jgi:hypothetical protein
MREYDPIPIYDPDYLCNNRKKHFASAIYELKTFIKMIERFDVSYLKEGEIHPALDRANQHLILGFSEPYYDEESS